MRRSASVALTVIAVVAAAAAEAKPGARARLTKPLPLGAAPGTVVDVRWRAEFPGSNGGRPFAARGMFVRLLSRTGARAATGLATGGANDEGRYAAKVIVPEGGIGGIRIGVRKATSVFLSVDNDPFRSRGGVRCDVSALRRTLGAFVKAYNSGDLRRLDRLFSRDRFVWFSAGGRAERDRTLVSFLMHRHHLADTLRSLTYRFNGYEPKRDLGHFELRAERRSLDLQHGAWFEMAGKGALDCAKPPVTLAVLALGSA